MADVNGNTPLHLAVSANCVEAVRLLAAACKRSVDVTNDAGVSPLAVACCDGKDACVKVRGWGVGVYGVLLNGWVGVLVGWMGG